MTSMRQLIKGRDSIDVPLIKALTKIFALKRQSSQATLTLSLSVACAGPRQRQISLPGGLGECIWLEVSVEVWSHNNMHSGIIRILTLASSACAETSVTD